MNEEYLDSVLFMSIELEVYINIDYGKIIEEFKVLVLGNHRLTL